MSQSAMLSVKKGAFGKSGRKVGTKRITSKLNVYPGM